MGPKISYHVYKATPKYGKIIKLATILGLIILYNGYPILLNNFLNFSEIGLTSLLKYYYNSTKVL